MEGKIGKVRITVRGQPKTKGSFTPFIKRVIPGVPASWIASLRSNRTRDLIEWEETIRKSLLANLPKRIDKPKPVAVDLAFYLERPRTHYRVNGQLKPWAADLRPTTRPDGDKLERAVWDALKGYAYEDDSQVVEWTGRKLYGDMPRVVIRFWEIEDETLF